MTPLLCARDVSFRYRPQHAFVVDGYSDQFHAGEFVALTGPSGGGKSTLLYLLAGLLTPTEGEISFLDLPMSGLDDRQRAGLRAANFGFIFQDAMLDPARTVLDNVCESAILAGLSRKTARAKASELLEDLGVQHRGDHRPGEISGGQAQRVAICRALISSPRVVFADEPTGNLDLESADVVLTQLRRAADSGACVIIATHSLDIARTCDRVIDVRTAHIEVDRA